MEEACAHCGTPQGVRLLQLSEDEVRAMRGAVHALEERSAAARWRAQNPTAGSDPKLAYAAAEAAAEQADVIADLLRRHEG